MQHSLSWVNSLLRARLLWTLQGSVLLVISRPTVWEQDSRAFGSTPELNAAPSISSLASHSYDGLDLETICFPSACIQLSLGQQSPFQLQPRGMGVGRLLHWLLSVARNKDFGWRHTPVTLFSQAGVRLAGLAGEDSQSSSPGTELRGCHWGCSCKIRAAGQTPCSLEILS